MPAKSHLTRTGETGARSLLSVEAALSGHPFLAGLSPQQRRLLADCARPARFTTGQLIFKEGDPANRFYLIQKGNVALECCSREQGQALIQIITTGEVLGWSWLFPPYCWHFSARALEPTEAIFIYATPLRQACESDHELGYELFKRMAQVMLARLQSTRRQLRPGIGS